METRYFHGDIKSTQIAQALLEQFNRGALHAQQVGDQDHIVVQISTHPETRSGGQTAIGVEINQFEDGVSVHIGQQEWLGIAASLGKTAFFAIRNPLSLLGRLDDLAQDIENLQLVDRVWSTISHVIESNQASLELSEHFRRVICPYCTTANPLGESNCIACGAPLGNYQPQTCPNCGYLIENNQTVCPNCGNILANKS
ncbi:MAG: zinc ribbon domain-containing protein [Anaerolineales bacterium]